MSGEKTCVIFAGAPVDPRLQPPVPEASLYLCADGGLRLAKALGIDPDWTFGDFDSYGSVPEGTRVSVYPAGKDDTDTMLAAKYAVEKGCTTVLIYGGLGGRLDHTFANIQLLRWLAEQGVQGILLDHLHWITVQTKGTKTYPKWEGEAYFSLFSLTEKCTDVTLEGVAYPMTGGTFTADFPLGVSNQIVAPTARVHLGTGVLLVVRCREEK